MVISSDYRVGQHRDADHLEDAPHFNISQFWRENIDQNRFANCECKKMQKTDIFKKKIYFCTALEYKK